MRRAILLAIAAAVLMPVLVPLPAAAASSDVLSRVGHIVVIYQENWSFDSLYGKFPGANGLANAEAGGCDQQSLHRAAAAAGRERQTSGT